MIARLALCLLLATLSTLTASEPAPAPRVVGEDAYGDALPKGAKLRLGTSRFMLDGAEKLAVAPDGQTIAVTGSRTCVYSASTGRELWSSDTDVRFARETVEYSQDGRTVITTGKEGLALWDAATGKQRCQRAFRDGVPVALSFSADVTVAAYAPFQLPPNKPAVVMIWNPGTGEVQAELPTGRPLVHHLSLSADGRTLATCQLPGIVHLWDVATKKERKQIKIGQPGDADGFHQTLLSPDGSVLYTRVGKRIESWSTADGKQLHEFVARSPGNTRLWLSPDGKRFAAATDDGLIEVWDAQTGKPIARGTSPPAMVLGWRPRSNADPERVEPLPGEFALALPATGPPIVASIDVDRLRTTTLSTPPVESPQTLRQGVRRIAFTDDGQHILTIGGGQVARWDATTGKQLSHVVTYSDRDLFLRPSWSGADGMALSPDGKLLLVGLQLFDLAEGKKRATLAVPENVEYLKFKLFSADSHRLVAGGTQTDAKTGNVNVVLLGWDTKTGQADLVKRIAPAPRVPGDPLEALVMTPDGTKLGWATHKRVNGRDDTSEWVGWDLANNKEISRAEKAVSVRSVVAVRDNRSVLMELFGGGLVRWDMATGKFTHALPGRLFEPVMAADGKTFVAMLAPLDKDSDVSRDKLVVFDWTTGKPIRQLDHPSVDHCYCYALSPDGKWLVTGHADSTALVWEVAALPAAK